jgi:hypothetical protein
MHSGRFARRGGGNVERSDRNQEGQRLAKLYRAMDDGELETLARDVGELTRWARAELRAEMLRRGMLWREKAAPNQTETPNDDNVLSKLRFYPDPAQAVFDRALLERAGIQAHFFGENPAGPEGLLSWVPSAGVHLLVRVAELARSFEVLAAEGSPRQEESTSGTEAESNSEKTGKPVVLKSYRDLMLAMVDRTTLESAGIECFLYDESLVRLDWFVSNAVGGVKIVVAEKNAAEALKILAAAKKPD